MSQDKRSEKKLSSIPSSCHELNFTTIVKNNSHCSSTQIENILTRRSSVEKGKKMFELANKSKELIQKQRRLENRVKHIQSQQAKAHQKADLAKKTYEKLRNIRGFVDSEKTLNNTSKQLKLKGVDEKKQKRAILKETIKNSIITKKEMILEQKVKINNLIKQELVNSQINAKIEKEQNLKELQRRANFESSLFKSAIENKRVRTQSAKAIKEQEYLQKMEEELNVQAKAREKIRELEHLETGLMDRYKSSFNFHDSVSPDLLQFTDFSECFA